MTSKKMFRSSNITARDQLTPQRFNWLVRERLRDKLYPYYLHYVTDVIVPSDLERRLVPLPGALSFVYYFVRPIRLVGKYGRLLLTRTIQLSARNDLRRPKSRRLVNLSPEVAYPLIPP